MELSDNDLKRFWAKVAKKSQSDCWQWTASTRHFGYGQINIKNYAHKAHRISWIIHNGTIPQGMSVCHACDNTACVNPSHLFLGTHLENVRDMNTKGRRNGPRGETHPFAVLNPELVRKARELVSLGHSKRSVARMLGVSHTAIVRLTRPSDGTWRHVE